VSARSCARLRGQLNHSSLNRQLNDSQNWRHRLERMLKVAEKEGEGWAAAWQLVAVISFCGRC
jgi:hypothetical protein